MSFKHGTLFTKQKSSFSLKALEKDTSFDKYIRIVVKKEETSSMLVSKDKKKLPKKTLLYKTL